MINSNDEVVQHAITYASSFSKWMRHCLDYLGISDEYIPLARLIVLISLLIITMVVLLMITNRVVRFLIQRASKVSNSRVLLFMIHNKLPFYLGLFVPYAITKNMLELLLMDYPAWIAPLDKCLEIYLIVVIINTIRSLTLSFFDVIQDRPAFKNKPLHSYTQIITMILYGIGTIIGFAILTGRSAGTILTALGAASAVTMLVFQDSIKGFVGSIQMSVNNMVELGDWISMPKYGADGLVQEVTLTSVKVQNFDMTIITIPTYAMIADSFQNWKGMSQSGARQVNKNIYIKQSSIRFMKEEELEKYRKVDYMNDMIKAKEDHNDFVDRELLGGIVPVTNCDLFVVYAQHYLASSKLIRQGDQGTFTQLVRILEPTEKGVPIDFYFYTSTTNWTKYESIATEIMTHFMSAIPIFGLELYELYSDKAITTVNIKQEAQ